MKPKHIKVESFRLAELLSTSEIVEPWQPDIDGVPMLGRWTLNGRYPDRPWDEREAFQVEVVEPLLERLHAGAPVTVTLSDGRTGQALVTRVVPRASDVSIGLEIGLRGTGPLRSRAKRRKPSHGK